MRLYAEQVNLANGCVLDCSSALQQGADVSHYSHSKEVNSEPHSITEIRETLHREMISIFSYIKMQTVFLANKQKGNTLKDEEEANLVGKLWKKLICFL